jgi:protein-S-isoprenylcysteine O-methyltransferase Ste14
MREKHKEFLFKHKDWIRVIFMTAFIVLAVICIFILVPLTSKPDIPLSIGALAVLVAFTVIALVFRAANKAITQYEEGWVKCEKCKAEYRRYAAKSGGGKTCPFCKIVKK